jgi:hypothetical protein
MVAARLPTRSCGPQRARPTRPDLIHLQRLSRCSRRRLGLSPLRSKAATPSQPMPPEPDAGLSQEHPATSKPLSPPVAARAGRNRWVVPVIAIVQVLAMIAGLLIWAPWVSKVPTVPAAVCAQSPTSMSGLVQLARTTTGAVVNH